jgi:hypothetical protein
VSNQRLTLEEVQACVEQLPDEAIDTLAKGPRPDLTPDMPEYWSEEKDCRACEALDPLRGEKNAAANSLADWHGYVSKPWEVMTQIIVKKIFHHEDEEAIAREMKEFCGVLAYTRCAVIYAVARTEQLRRKVAEEGIVVL